MQYPLTTAAVVLAGIVQAIFSAMGDTVNFLSALMWALVLFVVIAERFWKWGRVSSWTAKKRALACLAIFAVLAVSVFSPLKKLYNYSEEDLRVSVETGPSDTKNGIALKYYFRNGGKQSALVRNVGIFEIVTNNKQSEPSKNIELCNDDFEKTLLALQVGVFMGPGVQVGGDDHKSAIYWPKVSAIEGAPWQASEPLSIEAGKTKILISKFELEPSHVGNFNVIVLCPLIVTIDNNNHSHTSICKGFSQTKSGNGLVLSSTKEQFQILPYRRGTYCPAAD